ncbi:archease [Methanothermococcus sp. SCGC AD-155-M21]|nr:archease [Methanothermococcus sp. SCGC AD-155-M21]
MYKYFETMADIGIIVKEDSLEKAFEESARALSNLMVHIHSIDKKIKRKIVVRSEDLYGLLYDFLTNLLIIRDSEGIIFSDYNVKIYNNNGEYILECIAYGEELNREKHNPKMEIKAITYHKMEIKEENGKHIIKYIVDI